MADDEDLSPPDISLDAQPLGISFHPQHDVVAVGLISGSVELHSYATASTNRVMSLSNHTDSCRAVAFSARGDSLYSASSDKSLCCIDQTGAAVWRAEGAHDEPINAMLVLDGQGAGDGGDGSSFCCDAFSGGAAALASASAPAAVATADDEGVVKVWDVRQRPAVCAMEFNEHEDFVSDLALASDGMTLLATSGDATLSVMDLRHRKLVARSEDQEDELMSVAILKRGRKVVCGTQNGLLHIFSWGQFGDMSDRMPGHPNSVDTVAKLDESTLVTGSSDGIIRIIQLQPHKLLGVVGDHDDLPIERLLFSRDGNLLGTLSHDDAVHFWDVRFLQEGGGASDDDCGDAADSDVEGMEDMDDEDDDEDHGAQGRGKGKKKSKKKGYHETSQDFFSDM